jgi:hypothetical protein
VKLYYDTGLSLAFGGTESSVALDGNSGSTTDEIFGSDTLNISIPDDGNKLLCYIVIDDWATGVTAERTAQFEITNDGIKMDQFGPSEHKLLARINVTQNANALPLSGEGSMVTLF